MDNNIETTPMPYQKPSVATYTEQELEKSIDVLGASIPVP